jgi:hypothetical protein
MADSRPAPERRARLLMGVVAASAMAYPLLVCAVQLLFAQVLTVDVSAIVLWLCVGVVCSTLLVGAVRWGAARRVLSPWLLAGLLPPAAYELLLLWPELAR